MTQVNADYIGREFNATPPYVVSAGKIEEFARATAATNPAHFDAAVAQQLGYVGVIAPATFAVVIAQRAEAQYIEDPDAGIDFSRVVHANESFTYTRPIVAGDELHTVVHVQDITARASITMVTTRTDISAADGPVASVTSTLAIRGQDA